MQTKDRVAVFTALLAGPVTAFATGGAEGPPGGQILFSFIGGFGGGLLGAVVGCWLCNRGRGSKDEPKR